MSIEDRRNMLNTWWDSEEYKEWMNKFWWVNTLDGDNHLHVIPSFESTEVIQEHEAWHDDNQECLLCGLKPNVSLCPRNESCFDWRIDE